jgi:hypothetical protein
MSFESLARGYLRELQETHRDAIRSGEATPELSYRPTLDRFLRSVAAVIDSNIRIIYEPRRQGESGRPDWRFSNLSTYGLYGYAEAKPLSLSSQLSIETYEEQLQRYLQLGHKVIVTDGLDFIFCDPNGPARSVSVIAKPIALSADWSRTTPDLRLETHLRDFFRQEGFARYSEDRLIEALATRARVLSEAIEEISGLPLGSALNECERETIRALNELQRSLQDHHDPALRTPKVFSDFVSQVLVFSLFYAYRILAPHGRDPAGLYRDMQEFWMDSVYRAYTDHLRPLRHLLQQLHSELESLGPLGTWYDDCRMMLASIRLDGGERGAPNYHLLYERFLEVFDPKTRFDYGAFYTPPELATFAVRLTQVIAHSELDGKSLYEMGNKLIDPCCGTGGFLEQLIVNAGTEADKPTIIGFEILPAPYALAHYRLSMLNHEREYPRNVSVILTDTLSDELATETGEASSTLIEMEQELARNLSKPPLMLVIGNPPSSDSFKRTGSRNRRRILRLLEDFRPPRAERHGRQNIQKQIQNEFVKFLRWSCDKLLRSKFGILTMVLPASFAEDVSYKYARKWLTDHFQRLWFVDIDKDGRTGIPAGSLFNTRQGRMLLVGLKTDNKEQTRSPYEARYYSITDLTKEQKLEELGRGRNGTSFLSMFTPVQVDPNTYSFKPRPYFNEQLYSRFWPLYSESPQYDQNERCVFLRHVRGVKLAPSSLFVHVNRDVLLRRCRDISRSEFRYSQFIRRWFDGQDKLPARGKLSSDVRYEVRRAIRSSDLPIQAYAYRPFLTMQALISDSVLRVLARQTSSGTRARAELQSTFATKETIGFAVAPAPKQLGDRLHRFVSFCWDLPDDDLCKRGSAVICCNSFPDYKTKSDWDAMPKTNICSDLLRRLADVLKQETDTIADEIVYYAYAVLCSDRFLDQFEGALFAGARSVPKIPISADAELFGRIASKGKQIALLENFRSTVSVANRFVSLYSGEFELTDYRIDSSAETLELIHNNVTALRLSPIAGEVLAFTVSGYNVVKQWLKVHSFPYTRTTFSREHYLELLQLLARIEGQLSLIGELENDISQLLSGNISLL